MTTFNKLNIISHYKEQIIDGSIIEISYISMIDQNEALKENRDIIIDDILGENKGIVRSERIKPFESINSMRLLVKSMNINSIRYEKINEEIILKNVIEYIDKLTANPHSDYRTNNDIKLSTDHFADKRKILTKILTLSNYIASTSRLGMADCLLIHPDDAIFIDDKLAISSMNIIKSNLITKGKIVLTIDNQKQSKSDGLYVIKSNNDLFIKETDKWENNFAWFTLQ